MLTRFAGPLAPGAHEASRCRQFASDESFAGLAARKGNAFHKAPGEASQEPPRDQRAGRARR